MLAISSPLMQPGWLRRFFSDDIASRTTLEDAIEPVTDNYAVRPEAPEAHITQTIDF